MVATLLQTKLLRIYSRNILVIAKMLVAQKSRSSTECCLLLQLSGQRVIVMEV